MTPVYRSMAMAAYLPYVPSLFTVYDAGSDDALRQNRVVVTSWLYAPPSCTPLCDAFSVKPVTVGATPADSETQIPISSMSPSTVPEGTLRELLATLLAVAVVALPKAMGTSGQTPLGTVSVPAVMSTSTPTEMVVVLRIRVALLVPTSPSRIVPM